MPKATKTTFRDIEITFTEDDHRYVDHLGREYKSVTTLLKDFFEPFDADAISRRMEEQGKGDADELKASWRATADEACQYGTRVHETAEAALRGESPPHTPENDKERQAFRAVWDYATSRILPKCDVIGPELLVFDPRWLIAGTIDLPVRIKATGEIWLLDWKTNRKIDKEGFQGRHALGPLHHLQDCAWIKYCLQLNIYQQILTSAGYLPRDTTFRRGILYVNPETYKVELWDVPEMGYEALACISQDLVAVGWTPF